MRGRHAMRNRTQPGATLDVGLISDTHELLRPEAVAALRGSDRIVHAGDIGSFEVLAALDFDPAAAGGRVVVAGRSHWPRIASRDGVLYVNPSSAGLRRFRLPISLARLCIRGSHANARLVELAALEAEPGRPAPTVPRRRARAPARRASPPRRDCVRRAWRGTARRPPF